MYFDSYGNPFDNPKRKKHHNPKAMAVPVVGKYLQGVGVMDIAGALVGLVAATAIPNLLIKPSTGKTDLSTGQKWAKVGVAAATAIGAGYLMNMVAKGTGKSAIVGGMAGTGVQLLGTLGVKIGELKALPSPGGRATRVGEPLEVPYSGSFPTLTNVT